MSVLSEAHAGCTFAPTSQTSRSTARGGATRPWASIRNMRLRPQSAASQPLFEGFGAMMPDLLNWSVLLFSNYSGGERRNTNERREPERAKELPIETERNGARQRDRRAPDSYREKENKAEEEGDCSTHTRTENSATDVITLRGLIAYFVLLPRRPQMLVQTAARC